MYTDQLHPPVDWQEISTVLLDMDGTLLDKYYDDYFWEYYLPKTYGKRMGLGTERAKKELFKRYRSVENTLLWTDLDYWSEQLKLDIISLKREVEHLIAVHPYVIDFLQFLNRHGKAVYLVTAAHRKSLEIKMNKVDLRSFFKRLICAEEIGLAKEDVEFWNSLEEQLDFNRGQTLLADDNLVVLNAARNHGIKHLVHIAKPSSRASVRYCSEFRSVTGFNELLFSSGHVNTRQKN